MKKKRFLFLCSAIALGFNVLNVNAYEKFVNTYDKEAAPLKFEFNIDKTETKEGDIVGTSLDLVENSGTGVSNMSISVWYDCSKLEVLDKDGNPGVANTDVKVEIGEIPTKLSGFSGFRLLDGYEDASMCQLKDGGYTDYANAYDGLSNIMKINFRVKEGATGTAKIFLGSAFDANGGYKEDYTKEKGFYVEDYNDTVNITPKSDAEVIDITGVTLNSSSSTLYIGENKQLVASITPTNTTNDKTLTWKSSNPSVATIEEDGFITALSPGIATITVTTSNGKTATHVVNVPLAKSNIKSVANASKGITIKWNKIVGAQGYIIYRKTGSGKFVQIKKINNVLTDSYTDTTAKNGTSYTYAVRAYYCDMQSAYNTSTIYRINPVKINSLKNKAKKAFIIKYAKNKKATGYQIQYSLDKNFKKGVKKVNVKSYKTVSKTIKSLKKGKIYYVRIRAYKIIKKVNYYSNWTSKKVKISK